VFWLTCIFFGSTFLFLTKRGEGEGPPPNAHELSFSSAVADLSSPLAFSRLSFPSPSSPPPSFVTPSSADAPSSSPPWSPPPPPTSAASSTVTSLSSPGLLLLGNNSCRAACLMMTCVFPECGGGEMASNLCERCSWPKTVTVPDLIREQALILAHLCP
jgi:hypothetical protein